MKKLVITFFAIFTLLLINIGSVRADENKVTAIYFYSPTCGTCQKLSSFLNDLKDKHKNLLLKKYNITDLKNKSLMDKHDKTHKVGDGGQKSKYNENWDCF